MLMKKIEQVSSWVAQTAWYKKVDRTLRTWMRANGLTALRVSLGVVFFWFGILKVFPGLSPAEALAADTITKLTFGLMPKAMIGPFLGIWEVLIGIGLMTGRLMRLALLLLFLQMPGTFTPIFLFPDRVFDVIPFVPTLEGQYIFKNLILISAGLVLGGFLDPQPHGGVKKPRPPMDLEDEAQA